MASKSKRRAWTLDQGLAAQYAAQAGLDPDHAAAAGEAAWDVLKSLRDMADETNPARRAKRASRVYRMLARGGLGKYPELRKNIQARLQEIVSKTGPSINPKTGLQEFASKPDLPPFPSRKPLETQKFYWAQQWADEQPGEAFAQKARTAFEADLSNTPEGHARRNAQMEVFKEKWLPTNPRIDQMPASVAQNRDFLRLQGVNPDAADNAPIVDPELLRKTHERMYTGDASRSSGIPGFDALKFPDVGYSNFYNPNDQTMRMKTRETFIDDPMYPAYDSMRRDQDQSGMAHDLAQRTRARWNAIAGAGFGEKHVARPQTTTRRQGGVN